MANRDRDIIRTSGLIAPAIWRFMDGIALFAGSLVCWPDTAMAQNLLSNPASKSKEIRRTQYRIFTVSPLHGIRMFRLWLFN
jgi:hypothetical protein